MAIFQVPISKGGPDAVVEFNTDGIDEETYLYILAEGLKAILNTRMSKITGVTKLTGDKQDKAHAAAIAIAEENKARLTAGELNNKASRKAGSKSGGLSRAETTEARLIARNLVRKLIKDGGGKPSLWKASEITTAADALIASDPSILEQARANLASRASLKAPTDLLAGLGPDPKKVAAAEAKKAEAKATRANGPLSAAKAGAIKPHIPVRQRPAPEASVH